MTDEFKVTPDDLDKFGSSMRDLSAQSGAAKSYIAGYFDIDGEQARLFTFVKGMVDTLRQELEQNYTQLARLSDESATELAKSAQMYRTTDRARAKQLDEQYVEGR